MIIRKISALLVACAFSVASLAAQSFTIAVIPDAQNYSDYHYQTTSNPPFGIDQADIFYRQTSFVAANAESAGGKIAFAIQLGDLVQNYPTQPSEWEVADRAMSKLDGKLPFGVVPGNHDYDKMWSDPTDQTGRCDGGSLFDRHFGPDSKHFKDKSWYGGSFNNGMNSYSTFIAAGRRFMFLGLELEPSDASLAWAQKQLDAHPNLPTILVTHEYLSYADEAHSPGTAMRLDDACRKGFNRNTPQQVWDNLIKKNKQVFLVLCGHKYRLAEGENARTDINEAGFKVYQLLSDYQGRTEIEKFFGIDDKTNRGGDGWLRLMDFDLDKGEIHVKTYSTELHRYETDTNSDFTIRFDWDWAKRFH